MHMCATNIHVNAWKKEESDSNPLFIIFVSKLH
jgi:hypothetical protein